MVYMVYIMVYMEVRPPFCIFGYTFEYMHKIAQKTPKKRDTVRAYCVSVLIIYITVALPV